MGVTKYSGLKQALERLVVFILRIAKTRHFDRLDPSPLDLLKLDAAKDGYEHFATCMSTSMIFPERSDMRQFVIRETLKLMTGDDSQAAIPLILEFGVAGATSTNHMARLVKDYGLKLYGFDAFQGLQEDWIGMHRGRTAGAYTYHGKTPRVEDNVELVVGWVQDTLPEFLSERSEGTVLFAHFDMDTYSPGRFALELIKPFLMKGSVLLFDDFYAFPGWRNSDFKSLNELFAADEYEYIAFSHTQAAIRIL